MIYWDLDECTINDEVCIRDYLVGLPRGKQSKES